MGVTTGLHMSVLVPETPIADIRLEVGLNAATPQHEAG